MSKNSIKNAFKMPKIVFKCIEYHNLKIQEIVILLLRQICINIHINIIILQTKNGLIYLIK